jgi:hypothetical protein
MTIWFYLFRELLGAVRAKAAVFFLLSGVLLFLFLGCAASFFMLSPPTVTTTTEGQPIEQIRVFLSPRVPSTTVNELFLEWRERSDIATLRYRFAQELEERATGGVLIATPASDEAAERLVEAFEDVEGVTAVVAVPRETVLPAPTLSFVVRIALLAVLVVAIAASLLSFRKGYHALLTTFSGEIRLLRLSGVSERNLISLTLALGVLVGVLAGAFLFATLYILHQIAVTTDLLALFGGLAHTDRILSVGLLSLLLGTVLGVLAGVLGASALHNREYRPLP